MQEIRLHGRGGQGLVKASHLVVKTAVETGHYGQFIPFFGVERKGSPVFGFLRLSEEEIRRKTQVYEPDVLIILDDTLVHLPATYAGLKEGGTVVINSVHDAATLQIPAQAGKVAIVDATTIAMEEIGRSIPNTARRLCEGHRPCGRQDAVRQHCRRVRREQPRRGHARLRRGAGKLRRRGI